MSENITHTAVVDDGLRLMQAASEFFTGRIEMEVLKERQHIGKPGCDGQPV